MAGAVFFLGLIASGFLGFFSRQEGVQASSAAFISRFSRPAEAAVFLSLGMRRAAADLEMIRLLIYYGTPEGVVRAGVDPEEAEWGGVYPELKSRAEDIYALDPRFSYPILYAAGALAFNVKRPDEAVSLLTEALKADPTNARYKAYLAAVSFSKEGDPKKSVAALAPYLKDADCPSMVKNIAAFIYSRLGDKPAAAVLYRDLLSSRDEGYRRLAAEKLKTLR